VCVSSSSSGIGSDCSGICNSSSGLCCLYRDETSGAKQQEHSQSIPCSCRHNLVCLGVVAYIHALRAPVGRSTAAAEATNTTAST
jgi:hypothetical protein